MSWPATAPRQQLRPRVRQSRRRDAEALVSPGVTTPSVADPGAIATLRDVLDRQPFTGEAIREALGTEEEVLSRSRDIPVHLRRLRTRGTFGALVQLFVLNVPVPTA